MGNLVIANSAIIDAATITAGSQITSMPASNLQRMQPGDRWRTDDLNNAYLEIDLGAATAINLVALLYHNASGAATWRIRAAANQANLTAAPVYDSTALNMWHANWPADQAPLHSLLWIAATETHRWWRIDVSDAANADGYFECGRLYIDAAWQLPQYKNIDYGWESHFIDPSNKERSRGGQLYAETLIKWRELRCAISWLTRDEMKLNLYELQRRRGTSKDVLAIVDPDAGEHLLREMVYGQFTALQPIVQAHSNIFRSRFIVEEML